MKQLCEFGIRLLAAPALQKAMEEVLDIEEAVQEMPPTVRSSTGKFEQG